MKNPLVQTNMQSLSDFLIMSNITSEQTFNSIYLEEIIQGNKFQVTTETNLGSGGQKKYGIKTGDRKVLLGIQVTSKALMRIFFNIDAAYTTGSTTFTTRSCNDTSDITSGLVIKTGLGGGVNNGTIAYATYSTSHQAGNIGIDQGCGIEGFILDAASTSMFLIKNISGATTDFSFVVAWYEFD